MHESSVVSAFAIQVVDAMSAALPDGLGQRDVEALTLVASHEGCSVDWLRRRIGLTQPGASRLLDRLVSLGLAERHREGRTVALTCTREGRRALDTWHDGRQAALSDLLGGLSAGDRQALVALAAETLRSHPRERSAADAQCRTCCWSRCEPECPVSASVVQA